MTVSRFLNNKGTVAGVTAARIRKAMQKLRYTPNLVAKSLRINRTKTFGMVTSDGTHLLLSRMLQSILDASNEAGYSMLIANTNRTPALEQNAINLLVDKRIDGLLLCAPFSVNSGELQRIQSLGIPVVVIMRDGKLPVDCVISDNFRGGYEMVRYLIGKGVRDIRFFNLPGANPNGRERWRGNRQAMLDSGLAIRDNTVFSVPWGTDSGYAFMRNLIKKGVRRGAFVCGCDSIAVGAIRAALETGIAVPGEMQFCGFDDIDLLDYLTVPLTTMRQYVAKMGRTAIRLLLRRIEAFPDASEARKICFPCELVVRASA